MNDLGASVRALAGDPLGDAPLGVAMNDELQRRFLVWDACVGGRRRVDLHPFVLSAEMHRRAVDVAVSAAREIDRVADRAFDDEREAARYRFSSDVLRLARASWSAGDRSSLVRVDLLLGEDDRFHACEVNADCPGGHNEAAALPYLARRAGFVSGIDPTNVVASLVERLAELARTPEGTQGAIALFYATAYAEDLQLCAFLQRGLHSRGVEAVLVSPTSFAFRRGVLYAAGVPVRAIYRFFPTEWMTGMRSVGPLQDAVACGAVRTMSSFSRMFAQSKLAFARATSFDAASSLPPTFELNEIARERLLGERSAWVVKRALGRVGDQVYVGALLDDATWRGVIDHVHTRDASGDGPWIAQRHLAQRPVATPFGDRFVTLGGYVLDGRFVGWFARLTPRTHVSHDALCLPVFVDRETTMAKGPCA